MMPYNDRERQETTVSHRDLFKEMLVGGYDYCKEEDEVSDVRL